MRPESGASQEEEPKIVLRTSDPEDRPRAAAVQWSVGWAEAPARHRTLPDADAEWQAGHYFQEILAEVDGVIAGRVGIEAFAPPFAELVNLSVRRDYRRIGLGQKLTRACQEEAARRGSAFLFLQTEIDNTAAHRLYTGLGYVPTAHGKMLRMLLPLDYPLLTEFCLTHPLYQYACTPIPDAVRAWSLEWHAYVTADYVRLRLEGGASKSDSDGIGPSLTGCDWRIGEGERMLSLRLEREEVRDIEPGHHVELTLRVHNGGERLEGGLFQMILPAGVRVTGPATNVSQVFRWEVGPGETVTQPVTIQIEPGFDASVLWHLNYGSLSVCAEAYWEGHRALLSTSLPMAVPPP
jgi:ribosomal protein S18 acetylase RimI-like enzyme